MLAEKAERSAPRFFLILSFPKFSKLIVSGFQIFLFQVFWAYFFNFLRFGHDLSARFLFVQNIDEDRKPGFNHDLSERILFGSFLFRLYGKLTPFPKFLCLP